LIIKTKDFIIYLVPLSPMFQQHKISALNFGKKKKSNTT